MKKVLSSLGLFALTPAIMLAQEAANSIDLSAAGGAASDIGSAVAGLIKGDVLDAAKEILIAAVVLWALWRIAKWLGLGRK